MVEFYVKTRGHDFYYELYELLKNTFPKSKIRKLEPWEDSLPDKVFLVESQINISEKIVSTRLYSDSFIFSDRRDLNISELQEIENKKRFKRIIKTSLLNVLKQAFPDKNYDWGILTGVRPTKIVHELLEKGFNSGTITNELVKTYGLNYDKALILTEIADVQRAVLKKSKPNSVSVYIGIPFCPSKCIYCSFPSFSLKRWGHLEDEFVHKLLYEIEQIGIFLKEKSCIETVYLGGGTPTSLSLKNLEKILEGINKYFYNYKEFTVEGGRPNTLTEDKLITLKKYGVSRISINPQTMNDKTLQIIGRNHTSEDITKAYKRAKKLGFNSINMDLIAGLPDETFNDFKRSLKSIVELNPENITVHTLAIKRASKLKNVLEKVKLPSPNDVYIMMQFALNFCKQNDYFPYYLYRQKKMLGNLENIGFCLPDKMCLYNIQIMEERQTIIGLGVGAVTKALDRETMEFNRIPNVKDIKNYIERLDEMILRKTENPILQKTFGIKGDIY